MTTMMMIGNLLRVKDLPTNGEDSSRARAYACAPHHLSIANTKKRRPRRETKKATTRSQRERGREREREGEKQKKSAHMLLVMTRIGRHYVDWMFCGSHAQIITSKFNASSSSPLSRAQSCECQRFAFVFFVRRTSTTRPPLMVCPPRRGGEQRRDGLRL